MNIVISFATGEVRAHWLTALVNELSFASCAQSAVPACSGTAAQVLSPPTAPSSAPTRDAPNNDCDYIVTWHCMLLSCCMVLNVLGLS